MRRTALLAVCATTAVAPAGIALAGSAPKPTTNALYLTPPVVEGVAAPGSIRLTMQISPALTIKSGAGDVQTTGSGTGLVVICAKASATTNSVAVLRIPKLKFKLSAGKYRIKKSFTDTKVVPSATTKALTLKVTFAAVVTATKTITGTVRISGSGCAVPTKKFTATRL